MSARLLNALSSQYWLGRQDREGDSEGLARRERRAFVADWQAEHSDALREERHRGMLLGVVLAYLALVLIVLTARSLRTGVW